jgi:hypothetical protein
MEFPESQRRMSLDQAAKYPNGNQPAFGEGIQFLEQSGMILKKHVSIYCGEFLMCVSGTNHYGRNKKEW